MRKLPLSLMAVCKVWTVCLLTAAGTARAYGEPAASRPAETTQPDADVLSPCPAWSGGGIDRVELIPAESAKPRVCWFYRPDAYAPGQRLPLVVCLHGTDDTAEQMIAFWKERRMRIPAVLAAPQGMGQGWCSDDVATIEAAFAFIRRCVWHDANRVLLAGFSAGGVMTMQALYHDRVPATAAAALANYVPPLLTAEEVTARRSVPVFYAVGMEDINHERMRTGLEFLRQAGGNVELYHPRIGHTLDPDVAQAAFDWFFDQCDKQTDAVIATAENGPMNPVSLQRLEEIASPANRYPPPQASRAAALLDRLEQPGRTSLDQALRLLSEGKPGEAVEVLRRIESDYGVARLGIEVRRHRDRIEADPVLREQVSRFDAGKRADAAMAEYARAQKLVAQRRLADAAEVCRRIVITYADTPAAGRAQHLLGLLEGRTSR